MNMKYGVYDFFSYMLPGTIYLTILIWAADLFTAWQAPWTASLKPTAAQILVGGTASYALGVLLSSLSHNPLYVFLRKKDPLKAAFERVRKTYPEVEMRFTCHQWPVLQAAIRLNNSNIAEKIDKHRATRLMLRSMSLALLLLSVFHIVYCIQSGTGYFHYLLGLIPAYLSVRAARESAKFAEWSYSLLFEATIARAMDLSKLVSQKDRN